MTSETAAAIEAMVAEALNDPGFRADIARTAGEVLAETGGSGQVLIQLDANNAMTLDSQAFFFAAKRSRPSTPRRRVTLRKAG